MDISQDRDPARRPCDPRGPLRRHPAPGTRRRRRADPAAPLPRAAARPRGVRAGGRRDRPGHRQRSGPAGHHRRARHAHLPRARRQQHRGWPTPCASAASRPRTAWASCARNHRGLFETILAGAKLGTKTLLLNTDFAGPQLSDVCEREGVTALVHDEEFQKVAEAVEPSERQVRGLVRRRRARVGRDHGRRPHRAGRHLAPAAPGRQAEDRPADQRHHRHAEGRPARHGAVAGAARRLPVEDPAALRTQGRAVGAGVPRVGAAELDARPRARQHARRSPARPTRSSPSTRSRSTRPTP